MRSAYQRQIVCIVVLIGVIFAFAFSQPLRWPLRGLEIQLAGIRLGSPVIDKDPQGNLKPNCLLRVWGLPDFIVMLTSAYQQQQQGATGAPSPPSFAPPGMPSGPVAPPPGFGAPGGIGFPAGKGGGGGASAAMGSGFGGQPTLPGVLGGIGGMSELLGAPTGAPRIPGIPGAAGMPGAPGPSGAEAGGAPPILPSSPGTPTVGEGLIGPIPSELAWAVPVLLQLQINESIWLYKKGEAALGFLTDNDIVAGIVISGRRFDSARTALGDPFKSIKLGDNLQRVLLRYGFPDEIFGFNAQTLQPTNYTMTRNMMLRYHHSSNIEFTLLDYKVVRIFIFLPDRVTFIR